MAKIVPNPPLRSDGSLSAKVGRQGKSTTCGVAYAVGNVNDTNHVGSLDDEDILRLNQSVLVFRGLAVSPRAKQEA